MRDICRRRHDVISMRLDITRASQRADAAPLRVFAYDAAATPAFLLLPLMPDTPSDAEATPLTLLPRDAISPWRLRAMLRFEVAIITIFSLRLFI